MPRAAAALRWSGGDLICLRDGALEFGPELFPDPRGTRVPDRMVLPVQAYLWRRPDAAPVLIDCGSGPIEGEAGGGLGAALAAQGVGADDIGMVLLTHMHSDHCGGLLQGGFPAAQIVLSAAEAAHWRGKDHPAGRILADNAHRIVAMEDGDSPLPGLRLWRLPGHTPGHTGYVIDGTVAVVGDLVHRADIQLPDPRIPALYDVDRAQAVETRIAALERIARDGLVACGGHMHLGLDETAGEGAAVRPFLRLAPAASGWAAVPA